MVDTDALLAMGRLSDQLERRRTEERAAFAKRFARYDRKSNRQAPRRHARRGPTRHEGPRDLQHQGRRREDHHRGEPRLRGGPRRRARSWCGTSIRRGRPRSCSVCGRRCAAAAGGSVSAKGALADHVRGTDLDAVHVLPADFSLRHLDVHLEGTREPHAADRGAARAGAGPLRPGDPRLPPEHLAGQRERVRRRRHAARAGRPRHAGQPHARPAHAFLDDQLDAPSVAPFLSMVDRRKRLHRELVDSLGSAWPELLATAIPAAAVIERMGDGAGAARPVRPERRPPRARTGGCGREVATSLWGRRRLELAVGVAGLVDHRRPGRDRGGRGPRRRRALCRFSCRAFSSSCTIGMQEIATTERMASSRFCSITSTWPRK